MVQRKAIPVGHDRQILVTTERLNDGQWAVVASIIETTPNGERVVDLPVIEERFATEEEAETLGLTQARSWMEQNLPQAAA
jgi:hypothetical protein